MSFGGRLCSFCKHLFIRNWIPSILCGTIEITDKNSHLLVMDYVSRTPKELAVLSRWFPKDKVKPKSAEYLDVIYILESN
eukprot:UN21880